MVEDVLKSMHPIEKRILKHLGDGKSVPEIAKDSGMREVEVNRGLQWLEKKGIVDIEESSEDIVDLDKNGALYAKDGLPEKRFLATLSGLGKEKCTKEEIIKNSGLDDNEFNICIGTLKRKMAIEVSKEGKSLLVSLTDQGRKLLDTESMEEKFLNGKFPKELIALSDEERFAFDELKRRKQIIKTEKIKTRKISLAEKGKRFLKDVDVDKLGSDEIGKLTPEMLKRGKWKGKEFRGYGVDMPAPKRYPGKRHFVHQSIRYIKNIWLELGFKEMTGDHIQTSFWDLDSLFVPQDHPAREMQDTFYVAEPEKGKLPKGIFEKVKRMHESGDSDSTGWQYKFSDDVSKMNMARTHTTVLSAQTISRLKEEDLPVKVFAVGKVYRNEALDWKHLFEFYQVEGIVIDPNANLRHLIGYLREFYKKLGYSDVRVRPAHFPYTEPSLEVEVYHPGKKEWIELGGAGIFRPEVVKPLLGIDVPVLAWGQGLERGVVEYFGITDLRDIYRNDLRQMKDMKYWMK